MTQSQAYRIVTTLSPHAAITKFEFLTRWPSLAFADKTALYSEFQCHEINVFLKLKDAEFFAAVVQPFLACKLQKVW